MGTKVLRAVAALAAAAMLVAACGDDDGEGAEPTSATTAGGAATTQAGATTTAGQPDDVDPNGVLRLYWDLVSNGGPDLDPSKVRVSPQTAIQIMLYDSLFHTLPDGSFEPGLAESAEIVDPRTVRIKLKPGITFTDGTPLDAEAAKFSIERNRDAENVTLSAELQEITEVTVDDPLTFTIHLATPIAGAVYDRLPYGDFTIVSPTAVRNGTDLSANPVGAGPFMVEALEPGRVYRYVKNPDYFDADRIRLAGVEWLHIEPGQAQLTAIQSRAVDMSSQNFSYDASKAVANTAWQIDTQVTDQTMLWGQMCKNRPPFDDVRVRQALNYAIDREALNEAVYDGRGEPMWGFFASDSPFHNDELDGYYDHDPERARQLLAEAGQSDLTFESFFTPGVSQRAVEIIQAQVAEAGITMNVKPLTNQADFFPDAKGAPINIFPLERTGIQKVARVLVPGSVGNICNWDDAELNRLVDEIKAVAPESPEAVTLWHQLQEHALAEAMNLFGLFGVRATGYDPDRVGNPSFLLNFQGRAEVNFYDVYIKR